MSTYRELTDDELVTEYDHWCDSVRTASGWASVYAAATFLKGICREAERRGIALTNPFLIVKG